MSLPISLSFDLRSALIVASVLIPMALLWRYRISRIDSMIEKRVLKERIDRDATESTRAWSPRQGWRSDPS